MRNNSTILHRLHLWYSDMPEAAAQYYKDTEKKWRPISVRSYWLQVVRIAVFLQRKGYTSSERIALFAPNSPEWVHWELGTWLAGMVSVGIHSASLRTECEAMVEIAKPAMMVTDHHDHSNLVGVTVPIFSYEDLKTQLLELVPEDEISLTLMGEKLLLKISDDQPCVSIFTSGTTGIPKGVLLGLKQMTFVSDSLAREWNLPFSDGILFSFLPLVHIAEKIHSIAVALTMRYPVWFNSQYDRFLPELQEVRPTMLLAVPRVWQRMKEQAEFLKPKLVSYLTRMKLVGKWVDQAFHHHLRVSIGLDRLRLAVSGSAKLPPSVFEWFQGMGINIHEIYGMSETCGLITLSKGERTVENSITVGSIPVGTEVKLSPEGEVWVKGPHVFFGYDGQQEETHSVLLDDGWMKSGDLGEWITDFNGRQQLHLIGRIREIIKLQNGRMIAPVPIENEIKKIPEISNVCVFGDDMPGLVALITLKEKYLLDYKFTPGMVEGILIENDALKNNIAESIRLLYQQERIPEQIWRFFILSRDFELSHGEITPTQKLNRNRIRKNFDHFLEMNLGEWSTS